MDGKDSSHKHVARAVPVIPWGSLLFVISGRSNNRHPPDCTSRAHEGVFTHITWSYCWLRAIGERFIAAETSAAGIIDSSFEPGL